MEIDGHLSAPAVDDTIKGARKAVGAAREHGYSVGLVPTMGFFHQGHLSLMRSARAECDFVAVSIFVNPTQFAEGDDLEAYPRDDVRDLSLAAEEGIDLVFAPTVHEMYRSGHQTAVRPGMAATGLCGLARPGHFQGVATIVAKLFNIIEPDLAYFGQKDAQQVAVTRSMVDDLDFPVTIRVLPTIRENDGLAMSSRNAYLSVDEREQAVVLYEALVAARGAVEAGEENAAVLRKMMMDMIAARPLVEAEYAEVVDSRTMQPLESINEQALAVLAARAGKARLIDNMFLKGQE